MVRPAIPPISRAAPRIARAGLAQLAQKTGGRGLTGIVFFLLLFCTSSASAQVKPGTVVVYTMAEAHYDAHKDLQSIPEEQRYLYRYLARPPHYTNAEWVEEIKVLFGHINQRSRASQSYLPKLVAGGNLLRLNIYDYHWQNVYDYLRPPHTLTPVKDKARVVVGKKKVVGPREWWPGGYDKRSGKTYAAGWYHYTYEEDVYADLPFVPAAWCKIAPSSEKIVNELYAWTKSYVAVVRADWWLFETSVQEDRSVGYYDLLGLKNTDAVLKMVVYAVDKVGRRKIEAREAVSISKVGRQPRAIIADESVAGRVWKTLDFRKAKAENNPLRIYGRDIDQSFRKAGKGNAASEWIFFIPNDFLGMWLADNEDNRQDSAPDFVGHDRTTVSTDGKIHAGACMRCHVESGFQDVQPFFKDTFANPLNLGHKDYLQARLLREQYGGDLKAQIDEDRLRYNKVVLKTTGWTAKVFHQKWALRYQRYETQKVDLVYAARELGFKNEMEFSRLLFTYADMYKVTGGGDPAIAPFARMGKGEKVFIPVKTWEEDMPVVWNTLSSIKLLP